MFYFCVLRQREDAHREVSDDNWWSLCYVSIWNAVWDFNYFLYSFLVSKVEENTTDKVSRKIDRSEDVFI